MTEKARGNGRPSRRRGQLIVILALVLPILMGVMAMSVDVGVFIYDWFQLQSAVDASALAGASYLPPQPTQAATTAGNYASTYYNIPASNFTSAVAADDKSISVSASRNVPYFFGQVLGLTNANISAKATAAVQCAGAGSGFPNLAIDKNRFSVGGTITMTGTLAPGNWGTIVLNPANMLVTVGGTVTSDPGNGMGNGKWQALLKLFDGLLKQGLSSDPSGTATNHTLDDPRAVEAVITDWAGVTGSQLIPVLGLAELWIDSVVRGANGGSITITFISQVAPNNQPGQGAPCFGSLVPVLLQ